MEYICSRTGQIKVINMCIDCGTIKCVSCSDNFYPYELYMVPVDKEYVEHYCNDCFEEEF
jgi:hypothetical protein